MESRRQVPYIRIATAAEAAQSAAAKAGEKITKRECQDDDLQYLFSRPDGYKESTPDREARESQAVALCHSCGFIDKCLEDGLRLTSGQTEDTIWGGLTPDQLEDRRKSHRIGPS